MILAIALGHPSLLEQHGEQLAAMDFAGRGLAAFRDALVAAPPEALESPGTLAEALAAAGRAEERARILALAARCPTGGACARKPQFQTPIMSCGRAWPCIGGRGR